MLKHFFVLLNSDESANKINIENYSENLQVPTATNMLCVHDTISVYTDIEEPIQKMKCLIHCNIVENKIIQCYVQKIRLLKKIKHGQKYKFLKTYYITKK